KKRKLFNTPFQPSGFLKLCVKCKEHIALHLHLFVMTKMQCDFQHALAQRKNCARARIWRRSSACWTKCNARILLENYFSVASVKSMDEAQQSTDDIFETVCLVFVHSDRRD